MKEKTKAPVKCNNKTCAYNQDGICKQLTQEKMFYNQIHCEERKY